MNHWPAVIAAGAAAYLLKLGGYLVPGRWLDGARMRQATTLIPVALLTALLAVQTFVDDHRQLTVDARAVGLAAAVLVLIRRGNFLVVLVVAAAVTAAGRQLGMR